MKDCIARAIVNEFPKRAHPDNDDFVDAERYANAALSAVGWGVAAIAAERQRQINEEGWTPDHDDSHDRGELVLAALTYLSRSPWPWDYAPCLTSRRTVNDLVKAGALIAAEIERCERANIENGPAIAQAPAPKDA